MKTLNDPEFIESALSDFQLDCPNLFGNVFSRADAIRICTNAYLLDINKAYQTGDREQFFALFQVILKQEQDRNE